MKMDRLFNVLVLGGAAVGLAACGGDEGSSEGAGGGATGSSATGGGATGSSTSGNMATSSASTGGGGGGGAGGAGGAGGSATGGAGGSGTLECSAMPDPADPCGCPCCWVTDCLNTELCCIDFCEGGNGGLGCCGG